MPANLLLTDAVALRRGARGVWEYSPACQAAARAYAVAFPAILRGLGLQVPTRTHAHTRNVVLACARAYGAGQMIPADS